MKQKVRLWQLYKMSAGFLNKSEFACPKSA